MPLLHSHGHVVGFSRTSTWRDIDGRPHTQTKHHLSMWLYIRACLKSGCPGIGTSQHDDAHLIEHTKWRMHRNLPAEDNDDDGI